MPDKQQHLTPGGRPHIKRPACRSKSRSLWALAGLTAFIAMVGLWKRGVWLAPALGLSTVVLAGSSCQFDLYSHLGNLSPYFVPSNTPKSLQSGTPSGCTVERGFLIHRHGSRNPLSDELLVIQDLAYYINNNTALFSSPQAELPASFSFLRQGWNGTFTTNDLSAPGRQQLFDHGVAMRLTYPSLFTDQVLAGDQDRVVESAVWFMDGYYGRSTNDTATLSRIAEDDATISWITPANTCDGWDYSFGSSLVSEWDAVYLPPIATRINNVLSSAYPGVNFTAGHVHGMLYACAYGTAVYGVDSSPWCPVFLPEEILDNEYEYDLLMRGAFGYGLPDDMGPVLGSLLVSNVTAFLQDTSGPNLSLNFGHDTTIDLGLAALGLAFDSTYPTEGPANATRAWRTSNQVPFAAQMFWRGLSCQGEQRIQLLLNEANFDLGPSGCQSDEFGTCSMEDFLASGTVDAALNVTQGDARWVAACGVA